MDPHTGGRGEWQHPAAPGAKGAGRRSNWPDAWASHPITIAQDTRRGAQTPRITTLMKIAKALGVVAGSVAELASYTTTRAPRGNGAPEGEDTND